ncbi:hypothetical protein Pta02_04770 [Planobispora takensis]|uniref:Uncharacterized protein n=2 Tax=Planobispora takensis TaxID=1367882 RepID=A0A8J3SPY5_9ACTN|nr:hypothetical protein Pta02_04770 [Planobispora takensis]
MMLDEQEARAVATLLEAMAGRLEDDPLAADARQMVAVMRERLERARHGGRAGSPRESTPAHAEAAFTRDDAAAQRDLAAHRRDEAAARRDEAAVTRHQEQQRARDATDAADRAFHDVLWAAEQRDRAAEQADCSADASTDADADADADADPQTRTRSRQRQAVDHEHNQRDRAALRDAWTQVRDDRAAARTDVAAARQDRLQAQRDRQASAHDRTAAQADRQAAQAEREQAIVESQQRWPPWLDETERDDLTTGARTGRPAAAVHDTRQQAEEAGQEAGQAGCDAVTTHRRAEQIARRLSELQARREGTAGGDGQATS